MRTLHDDEIKDPSQYDHLYFFGLENKAIRYYYYLNRGLDILNQFRNLFLGIFALYFTLHLTNPFLLGLMFLVGSIILLVMGYYTTHTMNKVTEWLGMRFASHYAIRQFNYQQGIYETLQAMLQSQHEKDSKEEGALPHRPPTGIRGRDTEESDARAQGT